MTNTSANYAKVRTCRVCVCVCACLVFDRNAHYPLDNSSFACDSGDCDEDSQCEGNLKCYERKREGDEVPGCSGGGAAKSLSDFCYDPSAEQVLTYRSNESKIDKKRPKVLRW